MSRLVRDHWFRADYANEPCRYSGCGRPQSEHIESVSEWRGPRHPFRPSLRHPSRCARCGRPFGHSTHHGSRKNRQIWRHPMSARGITIGIIRQWAERHGAAPETPEALLDAYHAEALLEAIEAARGEYLTDDTGTPEDAAYNRGVADAVAAIGAIAEHGKDTRPGTQPGTGESTQAAGKCLGFKAGGLCVRCGDDRRWHRPAEAGGPDA